MTHPRPRPWLGVVMALVAAVLFAVNGSAAKRVMQSGLDATQLTTLRATGAALGLFLLCLLIRPKALVVRSKEWRILIPYGLVAGFLTPLLYFITIKRLPVGIGLLLEFTAPLFIALWAKFVQRRAMKPQLWAGFALCLIGLAVIAQVWQDIQLDSLGVMAGVAAAISLAAYYLLGEHGLNSRDPLSLTFYAFLVAALAGALLRPWWTFPVDVLGETLSNGLPLWILITYIIVLGTIVPYLLVLASLQYIPPTTAGILGMMEPVAASIIAWFALSEVLTDWQIFGSFIVLAGIVLAQTARNREKRKGQDVPMSCN